MLQISEVSKSFDAGSETRSVLAGVDLRVDPGEFTCLYGASGSGKTTLLHIAAGLVVPDSGTVRVGSDVLSELNESARARIRLERIGVVFQRDNLISELTSAENVALPLLGLGTAAKDARRMSLDALEMVGMDSFAERRPDLLSGGERQRVGIARAIVGERKLLVADEPTGALDSDNSVQLFELLRDLAKMSGISLLVATHDPLAVPMATKAMTMRDGKVCEA